MKAWRKRAPGPGLWCCDVPRPPAPGPGEVLVRVEAAGICGSDLHIEDWSGGYEFITPAMPVTLGHELAGRIAESGDPALPPGTPVVVIPSVTCGICAACQGGDPDRCIDRRGIGMTRDGGFAPFLLAPARNCLVLPPGFDPAIAALTEPLVIGARAVSVGGVGPGDRVLVLGPGAIGQAIALMAREAGAAAITVAGRDDSPRFGVLRRLGFDRLREVGDQGLAHLAAEGRFDVVFEAVGMPTLVAEALPLLRREGVLVIAGIHPRPAEIPLNTVVREQLQLRGTNRGRLADWRRTLDFVLRQGEALAPMVTHRLPLRDAPAGFAATRRRQATKVVLLPEPGDE
ncbi:zinc-dependent alcohol dehydrogenase [Falsiroseomonas ponticola]|uniref:zinc-dependent alcohol dehydrogenase n=1 Tax=Falsiroseomonas ponticola TaxID=2786951 RepID=UPI0019312E8C|nr:alcohol dehydrogenase catalytic domain-containing protein [Roseomonas ponticola]